jgi:hypothetical protein
MIVVLERDFLRPRSSIYILLEFPWFKEWHGVYVFHFLNNFWNAFLDAFLDTFL